MGAFIDYEKIISVEKLNDKDIKIIIDTDLYFHNNTFESIINEITLIDCRNINEALELLSDDYYRKEYYHFENEDKVRFIIRDYYDDSEEEIICKKILIEKREYSNSELKEKYKWAIKEYLDENNNHFKDNSECGSLVSAMLNSVKYRIRISEAKIKGYSPTDDLELEKIKYKFLKEEFSILNDVLKKHVKEE